MINYNNIAIIIVTYNNRYKLTHKVIQSLLKLNLCQIVLVDNGSNLESNLFYKNLILQNNRISLVRNEENLGSSGGFSTGIEFVQNNLSVDFLWFLDDDNVPEIDALKALLLSRKLLLLDNKINDVVLYSYRGSSRSFDKKSVQHGQIKKYDENNFMGFNFTKQIKNEINKKSEFPNYPLVRVFYGPYGGAFFSLKLIKKIGLPRSDFFVYADDHEYTDRVNKLDIKQFLVYNSQLNDIDQSFNEDGFFGKNVSDTKVYYTFRNHVYLNQFTITNKLHYLLNKYLMVSSIMLQSLKYFPKNYNFSRNRLYVIFKAINAGEKRNLKKIFF